jgi:site-specific DNA-methyltransferase (adenine-specific)
MKHQVKISKVKGNPSNPRIIKNDKFKKLVKSIKEFPEMLKLRPIVVDEEFMVLGGNMRLKASKEAGLSEVWIDIAEGLTEEQKKEFIVKDNVGFGEWEWDMLANEWDSVQLAEWGLDVWENEDDKVTEGLIDDDEIPEVKESKVKRGDIWQLGEHRVMCGDSTSSDDVAKLMNGEKADMVLTDPPYNISYKSGTWSKKRKQEMKEIKNDNLNEIDFVEFLSSVFSLLHIYSKDTDKYIFNDWKCFHLFREACIKADYKIKNLIVWNKEYQTQALNKFANAHEFIIFLGDNKYPLLDINVWNCKREFIKDHPTPKPIPLLEKAISYSSNKKELVLDMFLGSGSTLIAAEKLKRKCYGMELDEKYCDVIIERWEQFTGLKAIKNGTK